MTFYDIHSYIKSIVFSGSMRNQIGKERTTLITNNLNVIGNSVAFILAVEIQGVKAISSVEADKGEKG